MNWKRTLIILWAANFFVTAGMSMVIPFLPLYIEHLGVLDLKELGLWSGRVFSATFITAIFFQPLWGRLADKHGRKLMLLRACLGMGLMTTLMGAATSVWHLFFLRFFNGVFSGFVSMSVSLQASVTPNEHTGQALGTLQTGAIAGNLIGPLMGGVAAQILGFRTVFYFTGALLIVAGLIITVFVHENNEKPAETAVQVKPQLALLRPLLPIFIATTLTQVGMMSIEPIVSIYVKTLYTGVNVAAVAGLVVAITGIANLIGAPTLGKWGDRIGQKRILIISLLAAACMYIPQALAHHVGTLLMGRFLLGLFIGGMIPSLNVLVKKQAPVALQATAFGFNSSSMFLGNLIGPLLGSQVAALYGIRNVFYVTMVVLLVNALLIYFNKSFVMEQKTAVAHSQEGFSS